MKVSIIIPIYNVEAYIERCVRSVASQTYQDIEVLLIDDCGNDDSVSIAEEIIQTLPNKENFTILRHCKNRGLSAARNTGISHAKGKYIYFLDSDDQIVSDCISKLVEIALIYQPDFVMADHKEIGKHVPTPPFQLDLGLIDSNEKVLNSYLSRRLYVMAWNRLIKSAFIKDNNLYFREGLIYEDELWSFMVACNAKTIFVLGDKTYIYTIRPDSIMRSVTPNHYQSRSKIIRELTNFVNDSPLQFKKTHIYNYIEELKSVYFKEILSSTTPFKCKYIFYKNLRNSRCAPHIFSKDHKPTIPQLVRNIHYTLPTRMGYTYYKIALKLKHRLGV